MRRLGLAAVVALVLAAPARAQVEMGAGVGPESLLSGPGDKKDPSTGLLPLALATTLAFDATTWLAVQASSHPANDLTALMRKGYYKLELLQLVLVAKEAAAPLQDLVKERDKGATVRKIAEKRSVDFDPIYERSLALDEKVVGRFLPSVMRVSDGDPPEKRTPEKKRR